MNAKRITRKSPLAAFVEEKVRQSSLNMQDITLLAGFTDNRILGMIINDERLLPLENIPSLAAALECDSGHLFYLALQQFFEPHIMAMMSETFPDSDLTWNETGWLNALRRFHDGAVPELTPAMEAKLMQALRLVR